MASQPARKLIRASRDLAIKACSPNAAEIVPVRHGRLDHRQGRDHPQVNTADIFPARRKLAPRCEGILSIPQFQSACKVVPAAAGHDQNWELQLRQSWQMTVNGTIASENQNRIRFG